MIKHSLMLVGDQRDAIVQGSGRAGHDCDVLQVSLALWESWALFPPGLISSLISLKEWKSSPLNPIYLPRALLSPTTAIYNAMGHICVNIRILFHKSYLSVSGGACCAFCASPNVV